MPDLIYVVLLCMCAVSVTADWSPVWTDTLPDGDGYYAAIDPSFPDFAVVYQGEGTHRCAVNVTTGKVLWSTNDTHAAWVAVVRWNVFFLFASPLPFIYHRRTCMRSMHSPDSSSGLDNNAASS